MQTLTQNSLNTNCFRYWEVSPALWEEKLQQFRGRHCFVPVYWGAHFVAQDRWDFGQTHPECHLARLAEMAQYFGVHLIWLFPIGPFPLLPNLGFPGQLTRHWSLGKAGVLRSYWDAGQELRSIYSCHDSKIWGQFQSFLKHFSDWWKAKKIGVIWGVESWSFDQDFKPEWMGRDYQTLSSTSFKTFCEEQNLSPIVENLASYEATVRELFFSFLQAHLGENLLGVKRFLFLGSAEEDFWKRSVFHKKSLPELFTEMWEAFHQGYLPMTDLLYPEEKSPLISEFEQELSHDSWELARWQKTTANSSAAQRWFRFLLFAPEMMDRKMWFEHPLKKILNSDWPHLWTWVHQIPLGQASHDSPVTVLQGSQVSEKLLPVIFRSLLMGRKMVILGDPSDEIARQWELLTVENKLQLQKINFVLPWERYLMGEGEVLWIRGNVPETEQCQELMRKWVGIEVGNDLLNSSDVEGVFALWWQQQNQQSELQYSLSRRWSAYNPSSYRKKLSIDLPATMVLKKVLYTQVAKVYPGGHKVEVEFSPGGRCQLEFGVLETGIES